MSLGEKSIHASSPATCKVCGKELYELGSDEFRMECYCDANKTVEYRCNECMFWEEIRIKKEPWTKNFSIPIDVKFNSLDSISKPILPEDDE